MVVTHHPRAQALTPSRQADRSAGRVTAHPEVPRVV